MRAAVIGTSWGRVHTHALREAGVDVVAVCGRDLQNTRRIAREDGVPEAVTDLSLLDRLGLDMLSIATPAASHAGLLQRFRHLPTICEKPLSGCDGPPMSSDVTRAPVLVNYAFAFLDTAAVLTEALADAGAVASVAIECEVNLPLPVDGARLLLETTSHPFSLFVHLFGAPAAVSGSIDEGVASMAVRYANGVEGTVTCRAGGAPGIRQRVVLATGSGELSVTGAFAVGRTWRYESVTANGRALNGGEAGDDDCWLRANRRCIAAMVRVLRGELDLPTALANGVFDAAKAGAIDTCVRDAFR